MPVSYKKHLGGNYHITIDNKLIAYVQHEEVMDATWGRLNSHNREKICYVRKMRICNTNLIPDDEQIRDLLKERNFCKDSENHQNKILFLHAYDEI